MDKNYILAEKMLQYMEGHILPRIERLVDHIDDEKYKNTYDDYNNTLNVINGFKNQLEKIKDPLKDECLYCGDKFTPKNINQKFCGTKCKGHYKAHKDSLLKRCATYGTKEIDESITLPKVYKRDRHCYICGKRPLFNVDIYDDLYPNVDHIVPISKGGSHTWDNVKLTCRKCNVIKGAK